MKIKPNALELSGYRMPTEPEWEYACRAGSTTLRFYGDSKELLADYACYKIISDDAWRTGWGQPNRFGLHDMDGNVVEWRLDRWAYNLREGFDRSRGAANRIVDQVLWLKVTDNHSRVMRGGSFSGSPAISALTSVGAKSPQREMPKSVFALCELCHNG